MLIGLHLFSRAPGIKGVDMSFVHPPEVDMKFSPFGMTITEIPGILTALKVCIYIALLVLLLNTFELTHQQCYAQWCYDWSSCQIFFCVTCVPACLVKESV